MASKAKTRPYKVLAAATGHRPEDFSHADVGEVVILNPMVCDDTTGHCGCDRALVGMKSRKSTTVAKVAVLELTDEQIAELVDAYKGAWEGLLSDDEVRGMFDEAVEVASQYPNDSLVRIQASGDNWDISAEVPAWFDDLKRNGGK